MQKGINLATSEFENDLATLINTSGLPACVVKLILLRVTNEVIEQEKQLVSNERAEYMKASSLPTPVADNDTLQ